MIEESVSRRSFLGAAGLVGATVASRRWLGAPQDLPTPPLPGPAFTLGVASGDPLPNRVILWTRLAPVPLEGGGMPDVRVPVRWEVFADEDLRRRVQRGIAVADPQYAHSVHVDVHDLRPDREYWYRFRVGDEHSPVGRTRTAPPSGSTRDIAFAFASCQSWTDGFYPAYQHMANEDVRFVAHLGDYIYEGGVGGSNAVRHHNSSEILDLAAYRNRYALYKGDLNLQAAHHAFPWIVTWDDHEADNDYAGLIPELTAPPGDFAQRRAAAYRAWWEHQPVRLRPPDSSDLRIYRSFDFGERLRMFVLDTRQYRTDQKCGIATFSFGPRCPDVLAEEATMLGAEQEAWLARRLGRSKAQWNVLAQQTMMGQVNFTGTDPGIFNHDQWDGYVADRRRVLEMFAKEDAGSALVITGDIHSSWVSDLKTDFDDPSSPVVGTEFVGTSISSNFPSELAALAGNLTVNNPALRYFEPVHRGYVRCTLTDDTAVADYRYVDTVAQPTAAISTGSSFAVEYGKPGAQEA